MDTTELAVAGEYPLYNPDNDFRKLALDVAYRSEGFRLIDKEALTGVPFVIKRVVYREGFPRDGAEGDYISVECIVADSETLAIAPVKAGLPATLTVFPSEAVVFNDSGTGVRRHITSLLERAGLIDCGPAAPEGDVPWDRPFQEWESGAGPAQVGFTGDSFDPVVGGVFLAIRGLRVSQYEYMGNPAETYYFG
jgi:hypothetical protein